MTIARESGWLVRRGAGAGAGVTLVELLVSMAIFSLVVVLLSGVLARTQEVNRSVSSQVYQFREARRAFDAMSQVLAQATLQTYWDYDHVEAGGRLVPSAYVPRSDLRFVAGRASVLLDSGDERVHPGHALFFQAHTGFSRDPDAAGFNGLLNSWGYFVEYGDRNDRQPGFLDDGSGGGRLYRLVEFRQPAEQLTIFRDGAADNGWFRSPPPGQRRVLAENILLLTALPLWPGQDEDDAGVAYDYDSAGILSSQPRMHQLPARVRLTLVALEAGAAGRLAAEDRLATLLPEGLFADPARFEADLGQVRARLDQERLGHRVFTTTVALRAARWTAGGEGEP